jgi:hypothetical protein
LWLLRHAIDEFRFALRLSRSSLSGSMKEVKEMQVILSDLIWFGAAFIGVFLGSVIVQALFGGGRRR